MTLNGHYSLLLLILLYKSLFAKAAAHTHTVVIYLFCLLIESKQQNKFNVNYHILLY